MKRIKWLSGLMGAVLVGASLQVAWAKGAAKPINASTGVSGKAYHFMVSASDPNLPQQEVWVAGEKFRVEFRAENGPQVKNAVYICDGKNVLAYEKGEASAEKHPLKASEQLATWMTVHDKNPGFSAPEKKENEKIGTVECGVQSFSIKGPRGEITVVEWTDPASGFVLKRDVVAGEQTMTTSLEKFETLASTDPQWFQLPAGVTAKEKWVPRVGEKFSDFSLKKYDTGETVKLSDYKGKKVVILNFFATWCGPCRSETPDFVKAFAEYKDKDVAFVSVDAGEHVKDPKEATDKVEKFVKEFGVQWPVLMDEQGKIATTYQVQGIPTNVVIDKDGVIKFYQAGGIQEAVLKKQLDRALGKGAAGAFQNDPEE